MDADMFEEAEDVYKGVIRASGSWEAVNSLSALYDGFGRFDEAESLRESLQNSLRALKTPDTTSRYLRTLACSIDLADDDMDNVSVESMAFSYVMTILVRERRTKKVPPGSILQFTFEDPSSDSPNTADVGLERAVEEGVKTITVTSPPFRHFTPGRIYRAVVRVLERDTRREISRHVQLVRFGDILPAEPELD